MHGFIVTVFLLLCVVGFFASARATSARLRVWRAFAARHRLRFHEPTQSGAPRLSGTWRGVPVSVQVEQAGSDERRRTVTRTAARFVTPLPRGLAISAEGVGDKVALLLGGQDIQVGHPDLDRRLRIRGEDEAAVRTLLRDWRVRQAVLAFTLHSQGGVVSQHQVLTSKQGFLDSEAALTRALDLVVATVTEIEAALSAGAPVAPVAGLESAPAAALAASPGPTTPEVAVPVFAPPTPATLGPFAPPPPHVAPAPPPPEVPPLVVRLPPAPPPPAPEAGDPAADLEALSRLGERGLPTAERQALVARIQDRPLVFVLTVERTTLTSGAGLPPDLAAGHTVIGKREGTQGPRLLLRLPAAASGRVASLGWGDSLRVEARLRAWDDFYRQAVLDAEVWDPPPSG